MKGAEMATALMRSGADALLHGRLGTAIDLAGEAIESATAAMVSEGKAGVPVLLPLRARARTLAGRAHLEQFDFQRARAELQSARADWRHRPDLTPLGAASTDAALASLLWLCDEPESAVSAAQNALRAVPTPVGPDTRLDVAHLLAHLAFVEVPGRAPADVWTQLRLALEALEAPPAVHPLEVANLRFVLGMVEQRVGHHREAATLFEQVLRTRGDLLGRAHPHVAYALHGLAQTCLDLNDARRCRALTDEALAMLTASQGDDHPNVTTILLTRGMAHLLGEEPDRFEAARADFEAGLRVSRARFGGSSPQNAMGWLMLGVAHYAAASAGPAEEALRTALQLGLTHPRTRGDVAVTALRHLAEIWRLQGRYDLLLKAIEYAVEVWIRHPALSAETAIRWALEGSEAALEMDDPAAAMALLETAGRVAEDTDTVSETLRGAVRRSREALAELEADT
jgi:tetratricopeptide (TPR) repeat protein